jgi:hypothetical protein
MRGLTWREYLTLRRWNNAPGRSDKNEDPTLESLIELGCLVVVGYDAPCEILRETRHTKRALQIYELEHL